MSLPQSIPPLSESGSSTAPSSALTTPDASFDANAKRDLVGDITPKAPARVYKEEDGEGSERRKREASDKIMMPPPPLPVSANTTPNPPRMARMPSLSQITEHLHIPTASAPPPTPPKLSLNTHVPAQSPGGASFLMSPSSRLKLPASAMTRSRSGSGASTATLASLGMARRNSHSPASASASALVSTAGLGYSPLLSTSTSVSPSVSPAGAGAYVVGDKMDIPISPRTRTGAMGVGEDGAKREYVQGYKDVPSLETIRQRMSISSLADVGPLVVKVGSTEGLASVPRPNAPNHSAEDSVEVLRDDAAGGSASARPRPGQHPLRHPWTLYYDAKNYTPALGESAAKDGGTGLGSYEQSLLQVGIIDTVESFARHMNNLRAPSRLAHHANYHMFKHRIRPMWEDPANANGGKWVVLFRACPGVIDLAWANLTMALVGEMLDEDDGVCGIVASSRPKVDRIQVWTRSRDNVDELNKLGKNMWEMMGLEKAEADHVSIEFQYNSSATPPADLFFHVPYATRNFHSPATPSRLGPSPSLPALNFPPTPMSGRQGQYPAQGFTSHPRQPSPLLGNSPLQLSNRQDSSSPSISPSPSPRMGPPGGMTHALPRAPDGATIKAAFASSPSMPGVSGVAFGAGTGSGAGIGGLGMKRLGSGQGGSAFTGPMGNGMGGFGGAGVGAGLGIKGGAPGLSPRPHLRTLDARTGGAGRTAGQPRSPGHSPVPVQSPVIKG